MVQSSFNNVSLFLLLIQMLAVVLLLEQQPTTTTAFEATATTAATRGPSLKQRVSSFARSTFTATAAPTTYEEDLALTVQLLLGQPTTTTYVGTTPTTAAPAATKNNKIGSPEIIVQAELSLLPEEEEEDDISVPYDAAARLAYQASDQSVSFEDFHQQYIVDTVAMIKAKQPGYVEPEAPRTSPRQRLKKLWPFRRRNKNNNKNNNKEETDLSLSVVAE